MCQQLVYSPVIRMRCRAASAPGAPVLTGTHLRRSGSCAATESSLRAFLSGDFELTEPCSWWPMRESPLALPRRPQHHRHQVLTLALPRQHLHVHVWASDDARRRSAGAVRAIAATSASGDGCAVVAHHDRVLNPINPARSTQSAAAAQKLLARRVESRRRT